jgi:hypothetical protein
MSPRPPAEATGIVLSAPPFLLVARKGPAEFDATEENLAGKNYTHARPGSSEGFIRRLSTTLQGRKFKRRGFANTQPTFPFSNHFDVCLSTQSITSTTPTIPPVSTSNGTEVPYFRFTHSIFSVLMTRGTGWFCRPNALARKRFCCSRVLLGREEKVEGRPSGIHRTIQVAATCP